MSDKHARLYRRHHELERLLEAVGARLMYEAAIHGVAVEMGMRGTVFKRVFARCQKKYQKP